MNLLKEECKLKKNANNVTIINDCYNANYDSMKAALEYLGEIKAKRKIAVLGDMLELGNFSKELHEKVGEEVAKNNIDMLVVVGEEAKHIVSKALEKGLDNNRIYICKNNEEAIKIIKKISKPEDAILLKASNAMNFQEIFNSIIN